MVEPGTVASHWISLSGIAFAQESSGERMLPLRNSWVTWGDIYKDATFNMKHLGITLAKVQLTSSTVLRHDMTLRNGLCFLEAGLR